VSLISGAGRNAFEWVSNGYDSSFYCGLAHRIKMIEKINHEAKEGHVAEMAAYEARSERSSSSYIHAATNQNNENDQWEIRFLSLNENIFGEKIRFVL
jgi:hypothetical protein